MLLFLDLSTTKVSITSVAILWRKSFLSFLDDSGVGSSNVDGFGSSKEPIPRMFIAAAIILDSISRMKNLLQALAAEVTSPFTFLLFIRFLSLYMVHLSPEDEMLYKLENAT